jgi:hypothetical protein
METNPLWEPGTFRLLGASSRAAAPQHATVLIGSTHLTVRATGRAGRRRRRAQFVGSREVRELQLPV